jgi:DNA-binding transcriptional regulator YhcF (GntR family)
MDPYSGMVEMLEQKGIIEKTGNKLLYVSPVTGEEIKEFRKGWTSEKLQVIIDEWDQNPKVVPEDVEDDIDETELDDPSVYEENVE